MIANGMALCQNFIDKCRIFFCIFSNQKKGSQLISFLKGSNIVHGKIIWDHEHERSLGRGVLTSDAIYIPVKDSVLKLDIANKGAELSQVGLRMT